MTLCSSGSLSILGTAGTNRSISCEVDGNTTPPKSLKTLSATANKSVPVGMLEFYGYAAVTYTISADPDQINFPSGGDTKCSTITTGPSNAGCWNIVCTPNWASAYKSNNWTIAITAPPNSTSFFNIGNIVLEHSDDSSVTEIIALAQEASLGGL